jgi:hypothetical protein
MTMVVWAKSGNAADAKRDPEATAEAIILCIFVIIMYSPPFFFLPTRMRSLRGTYPAVFKRKRRLPTPRNS